jgi:hypothetical protein
MGLACAGAAQLAQIPLSAVAAPAAASSSTACFFA